MTSNWSLILQQTSCYKYVRFFGTYTNVILKQIPFMNTIIKVLFECKIMNFGFRRVSFYAPDINFENQSVAKQNNSHCYLSPCGSGMSVGKATDYGLDGPGLNPGGDEIFRSSRPVLGPTQSPVKWVPGLSRG